MVSACLWCDVGNHPFPAGQVGSTQIGLRQQVKNQWGGTQPNEQNKDVCAACAADSGLANVGTNKQPSDEQLAEQAEQIRSRTGGTMSHLRELVTAKVAGQSKVDEAKARGYDPEYIEFLEKKNGVGQ